MAFVPPRPYTVTAVILMKCENCGAPEQAAGRSCHYCGATVRETPRKPPIEAPPELREPKTVRE